MWQFSPLPIYWSGAILQPRGLPAVLYANPLSMLHQQLRSLPLPVWFSLGGGVFAVPNLPPEVATKNQSRLPRPISQVFKMRHRANVGPNQYQPHNYPIWQMKC